MRGKRALAPMRFVRRWLDPILAAVIFVAVEIEILTAGYRQGSIAANALLVAGMTLPLAWRRRAPLGMAFVIIAAALAESVWLTDVTDAGTTIYVVLIPPYTLGAWLELRRGAVGLAVYLVLGAVLSAMGHDSVYDTLFVCLVAITAWVAGRAMRSRRLLAEELEAKAARIESEREDRARLAVADERTRIARELHAVVANSVTAMVVEAETAERLLDDDPAAATTAAAEIEATGREALANMRRILGVLRSDDQDAERAPQPGIGQVHRLLEEARAHGLEVELRIEGEPGPVPAGIDLAAYRIMQETLNEVVAHAAGQRAVAIVRYGAEDLELCFEIDGLGGLNLRESRALLGVRERVRLYNGDARVERTDSGHYRLLARLPRAFEELVA